MGCGVWGVYLCACAGDAEWKSVAYGAPCIQLMREAKDLTAPFSIRIVIAEVESGKL